MKATGIVRRIDDLGRVVIPKEIRRTLRIREGDPLEIFTDKGIVSFRKYSPINELFDNEKGYAEVLANEIHLPVIFTDNDMVVACGGCPKRDFIEKTISPEINELLETRRPYYVRDTLSKPIPYNDKQYIIAFAPIIREGEVLGSVIILSKDLEYGYVQPNNIDYPFMVKITAKYLSNAIEN